MLDFSTAHGVASSLADYASLELVISKTDFLEPLHERPRLPVPAAVSSIKAVVASKQELLNDGAEGWCFEWTSSDALALRTAVYDLALALDRGGSTGGNATADKALVNAAADGSGWLTQLCELACHISASWAASLSPASKARDHAPLELMCSMGVLLARMFASTAACSAGAMQRPAGRVFGQLCSEPCQRVLQHSVAAFVFCFRQGSGDDRAHHQALAGQDGLLASTLSSSNLDAGSSSSGSSRGVGRLLAGKHVPHTHKAWTGDWQLPAMAAAACSTPDHAKLAVEVVVGWCNTCRKADSLGLPVLVNQDAFMLAVEVLWLFVQPGGAPVSPAPAPADASDGHQQHQQQQQQPLALWPAFLLRLVAHLEDQLATPGSEATAPAASAAGEAAAAELPAAASSAAVLTGEQVQAGVLPAAGPLLLAMLCEALQQLGELWAADRATARAALVRSTIADSDLPVAVRQRRLAALLGRGAAKPKAAERAAGELVLMAKQLALVLTELLQLERTACGGPQRDGTILLSEAGTEVVWFSCLWRSIPTSMCQVIEVLLRCPGPVSESLTTLTELLLDDLWEAMKQLPLLQQADTARAVAAVVMSGRKAATQWQAAISEAVIGSEPPAGSRASPAAPEAAAGSSKKRGGGGARGGKGGKAQAAAAAAAAAAPAADAVDLSSSPPSAFAGGEGAGLPSRPAGPPGWMVAVAAADAQQALKACLTLLVRLLDNAQKAYYWRWFIWWEQQQQAAAADDTSAATATAASSSIWSDASDSSFLSAPGAEPTAAPPGSVLRANPDAIAWADTAVQLALGLSALAGPAFRFVDDVITRGFSSLPEAQRKAGAEATLALLEPVSGGLQANSLLLGELHRRNLLPVLPPGAGPALELLGSCLEGMQSSASAAAGVAEPEPGASLDAWDCYWAALGEFDAADKLRLSRALGGLVVPPALVAGVGCRNPACPNLCGPSECRLATMVCRACFHVSYCSRECQVEHWRGAGYGHKLECRDHQH